MKEKRNILWPVILMLVFAVSRWPGFIPVELQNFSAAYAIAFCAGVYLPRGLSWWLPLATLALTDLVLNCYYYFARDVNAFQWYQLVNYLVYALIIGLGRRFSPRASWWKLVGGGLMGAILFYLVTNTAAWLFNPFGNPEYLRTFEGWLIALTTGTKGWPHTWEFFRNTLLSGGLFTGLFVGAMRLSEMTEPERQPEEAEEESEPAVAEEGKA